jgi:hypothetical protein
MNYSDIYQQRQQIESEYRYRIQQLQQEEQRLRQSPYQSYEQMTRPQSQVRTVSGIEEVQNSPAIPFETLYFSDSQNGRIYTKQIGVDGNAVIDVFINERAAKTEPKKAKPEDGADIKKVMKALADIESRLAAIEKPVETKEAELEFSDEHTANT